MGRTASSITADAAPPEQVPQVLFEHRGCLVIYPRGRPLEPPSAGLRPAGLIARRASAQERLDEVGSEPGACGPIEFVADVTAMADGRDDAGVLQDGQMA